MYARRFGVVIGIDAYENGVPPLASAVSDARSIAHGLRSLGFERVFELYDDEATHAALTNFFEIVLPDQLGTNDLLVVYFAGHGMVGRDGESYLLPQDSTLEVQQRGVSMQELKEAALGLEARGVLYLVDACLSGAMLRRSEGEAHRVGDAHWREIRGRRVVQVISAGKAEEAVFENRRTGLFSAALRAGLFGGKADEDLDFVITTEELGDYARRKVVVDSGGRQHPQWGTIEGGETIRLFDGRHVAGGALGTLRSLPKEEVPGMASELAKVHQLMDERRWVDAEDEIRDLIVFGPDPELYVLLAEVYLERGTEQSGAFGNEALVEEELRLAERGPLTEGQKRRIFEIRKLTKVIVRGGY